METQMVWQQYWKTEHFCHPRCFSSRNILRGITQPVQHIAQKPMKLYSHFIFIGIIAFLVSDGISISEEQYQTKPTWTKETLYRRVSGFFRRQQKKSMNIDCGITSDFLSRERKALPVWVSDKCIFGFLLHAFACLYLIFVIHTSFFCTCNLHFVPSKKKLCLQVAPV